jgi:FkbM family methyltransferase
MTDTMNDPYWAGTGDFLQKYVQHSDKLVAPSEFTIKFSNSLTPYNLVNKTQWNDYQWFVIHKGQLNLFSYYLLEGISKEFFPVFANEVFVVFSSEKISVEFDSNSRHLISFSKSLAALRDAEGENISEDVFEETVTQPNNDRKKGIKSARSINPIESIAELASMTRNEIESAARIHSQSVYLGHETLLCRALSRYMIYCDAGDQGITPHLCLNGYWEIWVTMTMAKTIRTGWYCLDIGANHGYYTLMMSDSVGPSGRVLALEPNPQLVGLLSRTLEVNGFRGRTEILQKAISNTASESVQFVIPQGNSLNGTISSGEPSKTDKIFEVKTVTADEITKDWPRVDFIKIDVEGAEFQTWQCLTKTVEKNKNITIIMKFNRERCADPEAFLQDILSSGFKLKYIDVDAKIKSLTLNQCLKEHPNDDWMLFLHR